MIEKNQPPIITGNIKPTLKQRLINNRRRLFIIVLALVLLGGAYAGYKFFIKDKAKDNAGHGFHTEVIEGREFKVSDHSLHSNPPPVDIPQVSLEDQIKSLEQKITQGQVTYKDYMVLGQLYTVAGNNAKAIENYEKSKKTADPKMEDYQSFIDTTNATIKRLES